MAADNETALFEYVLRLGDTALINGQRLSEWCGHGPFLEEDIGVANTALDLIGRARLLLSYAGEVEGKGRSEDDLAYLRDERDWRNLLIAELPIGDFGFTTARQFLLDAWDLHLYTALAGSTDQTLAAVAQKTVKECHYHLRHTSEWMRRLGDGTSESRDRVQASLESLWPYTAEFTDTDNVDAAMIAAGIAPDTAAVHGQWRATVAQVLTEATLEMPSDPPGPYDGGRRGLHTEHMGHLLTELQFMQRAYPGLNW